METEETVKEGLVTASKAKSIWLAFVDIVLFAVLSMIFLFLFAIPFALVFPELKTEVGETNIYFAVRGSGGGRVLVFSHISAGQSFALFFCGGYGRSYRTRFYFRAYAGWRHQ